MFILELAKDGAADKSGKLGAGDKILTLDGKEVAKMEGEEVNRALKAVKDKVRST